jgi:hypothetical protein
VVLDTIQFPKLHKLEALAKLSCQP